MNVQLALTPDGRWDFPTSELLPSAAAAGFVSVGITADRVDAVASDAYAAAGLRCHELLALIVGDDDSATLAAAEQLVDVARTMNADWVLTVFNTPPTPQCIQRCAKMFDDIGAGMAVEFSPLMTRVYDATAQFWK